MFMRSELVCFSRGGSDNIRSKFIGTELQTDDIEGQVLTEA